MLFRAGGPIGALYVGEPQFRELTDGGVAVDPPGPDTFGEGVAEGAFRCRLRLPEPGDGAGHPVLVPEPGPRLVRLPLVGHPYLPVGAPG
jgi:hypothetical protein